MLSRVHRRPRRKVNNLCDLREIDGGEKFIVIRVSDSLYGEKVFFFSFFSPLHHFWGLELILRNTWTFSLVL